MRLARQGFDWCSWQGPLQRLVADELVNRPTTNRGEVEVLFGLIPTETRPRARSRVVTSGVAALAAAVVAVVVLAAVGTFSSGSSTVGQVQLHLAANTTPVGGTPNAQQDPFGAPGKPDYSVPLPPGESNLVTTIGTKTTQRIYGANPYQEAVSVTQQD